ncbi:hypothetical protein O1D97_15450 [Marinomonas sp. 15G1-11]|uniref:Uncharacterized protein n=1 Tax=Marinomonas phaeophyticola TaxID=3004091 RepID=A0ABT4JZL7_9GAMM|nr:hypothetical protein [Marinomonas sp. 15G1-11]MCZ2722969.1 hypothetical protein [Marinomonas sp. 15G1-11]
MVSELRQSYEQGSLSTIEKATLDGILSHYKGKNYQVVKSEGSYLPNT